MMHVVYHMHHAIFRNDCLEVWQYVIFPQLQTHILYHINHSGIY